MVPNYDQKNREITSIKLTGTLDFLDKKHVFFGQGLDFLKFRQGNRDENEQIQGKNKEQLRNNDEKRRTFDKKFRVRAPYFLLKIF